MTAQIPQRRTKTAREVAEHFGVSRRTVQRLMAEPREDFLDRAKSRRLQAVALQAEGLTSRQIGERLGCSPAAARRLIMTARQKGEAPPLEDQKATK